MSSLAFFTRYLLADEVGIILVLEALYAAVMPPKCGYVADSMPCTLVAMFSTGSHIMLG